jgi:hypothetical protein
MRGPRTPSYLHLFVRYASSRGKSSSRGGGVCVAFGLSTDLAFRQLASGREVG